METTEKIVEAYCRYVLGWFTIPNIKCAGQYEIDLLAIEPTVEGGIRRYHIESGISISSGFSKLTANDFSRERLKERVHQAGQRRTVGYFIERKFGPAAITEKLKQYGFEAGNYSKIIATWGWKNEAKMVADEAGVILWDFRQILMEVAELCRREKTYFTDDTLRTLQLFTRATAESK